MSFEKVIATNEPKKSIESNIDYSQFFKDATIDEQTENNDAYYLENYGLSKANFESQLNKGIAQSILGITKPWNTVKEELFAKIGKK